MRPRRVAGRADTPNQSSGPNVLADLDVDPRKVRIHGSDSIPVGDDDELSPTAGHDAGPDHAAGCGRGDGCAAPCGQVDAAVEAEPAGPERRRDLRPDRPGEPDRARRELRPLERADGLRSGNAIRHAPHSALVLDERSSNVGLEDPGEERGRETVPRQQELELRHVPTRIPDAERADTELVLPPP